MIDKLLSLLKSGEIITEPSKAPGSAYKVVNFNPYWMMNILSLLNGVFVQTGNGYVGYAVLPVDLTMGIHKKFTIVSDLTGNLNIAEAGFVVLRDEETIIVPTYDEAVATVQDQMVGEQA